MVKTCKMRANVSKSTLKKIKCKFVMGVLMSILAAYLSVTWINWDAALVFHQPSLSDLQTGYTKEVEYLDSPRWVEKRDYVLEIFDLVCKNTEYNLITNLNVRVLGAKVEESMAYNCADESLYVNLRINPKPSSVKLKCNESYGVHWNEQIRYHPLDYSYVLGTERVEYTTETYEDTCMFYQAVDLLKGTWKPYIKQTL